VAEKLISIRGLCEFSLISDKYKGPLYTCGKLFSAKIIYQHKCFLGFFVFCFFKDAVSNFQKDFVRKYGSSVVH